MFFCTNQLQRNSGRMQIYTVKNYDFSISHPEALLQIRYKDN